MKDTFLTRRKFQEGCAFGNTILLYPLASLAKRVAKKTQKPKISELSYSRLKIDEYQGALQSNMT